MEPVKKTDYTDYRPTRKWLLPLFVGLLVLSFSMEFYGSGCAISSVIGFPCPGCGSSRAAVLLFQGKLAEALRMHPLIILSLVLLLLLLGSELVKFIRRKQGKEWRHPLSRRTRDILSLSFVLLYLAVYIFRMIKYFPHTEPMVYNWNSLWGKIARLFIRIFS